MLLFFYLSSLLPCTNGVKDTLWFTPQKMPKVTFFKKNFLCSARANLTLLSTTFQLLSRNILLLSVIWGLQCGCKVQGRREPRNVFCWLHHNTKKRKNQMHEIYPQCWSMYTLTRRCRQNHGKSAKLRRTPQTASCDDLELTSKDLTTIPIY